MGPSIEPHDKLRTYQNQTNEERYCSWYITQETKKTLGTHDSSWTEVSPISDWLRTNRRISFKFCWQFIDRFKKYGVFYCAYAQMPGRYLASTLRSDKVDFIFNNYNKSEKKLYNSQEHLSRTCLRHLSRYDFEKNFVGKCFYSLTSYRDLVRISIPHNGKFMVVLNAEKSIDQYFQKFLVECMQGFEENKDKVLNLCNQKLLTEDYLHGDITWDFFTGSSKSSNNIGKELSNVEYTPPPISDELKNLFRKSFVKTDENDEEQPHPFIQYASIGTIDGVPLVRYEHGKNIAKKILISYDEFEFLIESTQIQQSREEIEKFFGNVDYNISVFEKIIEITIPISLSSSEIEDAKGKKVKKFLLIISINNNLNDEESQQMFFPHPIKEIFNFLHSLDWPAIISDN